jgi:cold shock CspA family protein
MLQASAETFENIGPGKAALGIPYVFTEIIGKGAVVSAFDESIGRGLVLPASGKKDVFDWIGSVKQPGQGQFILIRKNQWDVREKVIFYGCS